VPYPLWSFALFTLLAIAAIFALASARRR